jgi:glycosyltransferase involved in cell wall biosynthesis
VVASRIAGIPELLDEGRCGVLVPPRNPASLAAAIQTLLDRPELRREYARAGRAYAEAMFDVRRNGPRLASILRATTRPHARAADVRKPVRTPAAS